MMEPYPLEMLFLIKIVFFVKMVFMKPLIINH